MESDECKKEADECLDIYNKVFRGEKLTAKEFTRFGTWAKFSTIHFFIVFLSQARDRPNTSTTRIVEVLGLSLARDKSSDEMNNYKLILFQHLAKKAYQLHKITNISNYLYS